MVVRVPVLVVCLRVQDLNHGEPRHTRRAVGRGKQASRVGASDVAARAWAVARPMASRARLALRCNGPPMCVACDSLARVPGCGRADQAAGGPGSRPASDQPPRAHARVCECARATARPSLRRGPRPLPSHSHRGCQIHSLFHLIRGYDPELHGRHLPDGRHRVLGVGTHRHGGGSRGARALLWPGTPRLGARLAQGALAPAPQALLLPLFPAQRA